MKSKKSQISTQFAWIFILIAGAIILIFFITVIYKQKTVSETKISAEILSQLNIIFTGAGLTSGTLNIIQTPDTEINFICNEDVYSEYSIASLAEEIPLQVIFSPDQIKGNEIITWALSWNTPFKVTNFLYVTNSRIKYILVNPPNEIRKKTPSELPFEIVKNIDEINSISIEGIDKLRLVFFNDNPPAQIPLNIDSRDTDISAVKITPEKAFFYEQDGENFAEQGSVRYLDDNLPLIFGAIFSEDLTFYTCNMKKAFKRLSILSKIYSLKETELTNYFQSTQSTCSVFYDDHIEEMFSPAKDCSQTVSQNCINAIQQKIQDIEEEQELLIEESCPLLY